MQYVCGQMSRAAQKRNPGRGSQRLHRALGGTRILLAAAPTAPPCFCRWQRSSLLHRGFFTRRTIRRVDAVRIHPCSPFCKTDKTETPVPIGYRSSWWSEATQIRTIALWGIFGGNFIESDGFCAVFVVECNQNFFIIKINGVHERVDKRLPVAFHVRVEFAEVGEPKFHKICADFRFRQLFFRDADFQLFLLSLQLFQASFGRAGQYTCLNRI